MDIKTMTRLGTIKILMLKGEKGEKGADGSAGNYSQLDNKPQINGAELDGNMSSDDLSLASASQVAGISGNVSDLQTDVVTLKTDVAGLKSDVPPIQSDVAILQSDVSTLQNDVSNNTDNISTLQSEVADMTLESGETISVTIAGLGGYITQGQTNIVAYVPFPFIKGDVSIDSLSIAVRHADGGYPFMRSGSSYTQLGASLVNILSGGSLHAAVSSVSVGSKTNYGFNLTIAFANQLTKASGNTAAVTNNVPVSLNLSITLSVKSASLMTASPLNLNKLSVMNKSDEVDEDISFIIKNENIQSDEEV